MAKNEYVWQTPSVCKGVNNSQPEYAIDDAELSDARNYSPDTTGQGWLIKREGITKVSSAKTRNTYSIFNGRNGNYFHNGTVIYDFSGTSLATLIQEQYDSWASFATYDLFCNGTDSQYTSDGANFSTITGMPAGVTQIASCSNFLYFGGHNKGEVGWFDYGTLNYSATNALILSQDQNDDIIALAPVNNNLGIWCLKSFYMLSGYSTIDQEITYSSKVDGCAAPRSVVITPYGLFWWSIGGIVWCKSGYELDYPMQRKLRKTLSGLNRDYDGYVHAVWDKIHGRVMFWLFSGSTQTQCNLRVDYYPLSDSFFLHDGIGCNMSASAFALVNGTADIYDIYIGGYVGTTYLYRHEVDSATDDGTQISSYEESKREGNPSINRFGKMSILTTDLTDNEVITYSVYQDNESTVTMTGDHTIGTGLHDQYISVNLQNYRIKHRIADNATTRTRILGLTHTGSNEAMV